MLNTNTPVATTGRSSRRATALSTAIVAALGMAVSSSALADAELDALKQQVQELQQKIDAMAKQQAAAAAAPAAAPAAPAAAPAKAPTDGAVSMYGITLSGVLDVNLFYQSHGTPVSDYFNAGNYSYIQKNSNKNLFTLGENGLSSSRLTLAGEKEIMNGWAGIFRLETAINPLSGNLSDGLKSLTVNNGRPLTAQTTGADTSINGELFNSAAFVGFTNKEFGTITFGRQNGLLADGIAKYDPMAASQAFSVIGISGTAGGGGATENRRLDNSVKYDARFGMVHVGVQYQFNGASGQPGTAYQFVVGGTFPQGSVDAFWTKKYDAIASASLSAAQVATLNCPYTLAVATEDCGLVGGGGNALDKSLAGTVSDNTAWALMGQYVFRKAKFFGAYEHIQSSNPVTPLAAGTNTLGGYVLAYVNQQANVYNPDGTVKSYGTFAVPRILQFVWVGMKYSFTPNVDWTIAWYQQMQSSYATGANSGCNDGRAGNCSGRLNAYSTDVVYKLSKRFDMYGGLMWSGVDGGLKNGFLNTNTINPTMGMRFTF